MQQVLISACLLGHKVRYDAGDCRQSSAILLQWQAEGRLIPLCPETAGGLSTPRPPAEIQPDGHVISVTGEDVSGAFSAGAQQALALCQQHAIRVAILKQGSPSCGNSLVNDGSFQHRKIAGQGVTAALLQANGVCVFNEDELDDAYHEICRLESSNGQ